MQKLDTPNSFSSAARDARNKIKGMQEIDPTHEIIDPSAELFDYIFSL